MKFSTAKYFLVTSLILLFVSNMQAQTFGFGCLGLSGFYAGYSRQNFVTPAINDYVNKQIDLIDPFRKTIQDNIQFQQGTGYRIGANIFRAKWDRFFFTAKGYYQFLREQYEVSTLNQTGLIREKYKLTMNHWGIGLDLGIPLFWILDWKIVEGNVTFFNSEFDQENFLNNIVQKEIKFNPDKNKVGYFIGSGLILHLVPDYLSIEGTAGYNFILIEKMESDTGLAIPLPPSQNKAIEKGSFSATIQLNVGFPL